MIHRWLGFELMPVGVGVCSGRDDARWSCTYKKSSRRVEAVRNVGGNMVMKVTWPHLENTDGIGFKFRCG